MKKKIMYAIPLAIATIAMILLTHHNPKPVTPTDVLVCIIGFIFMICFVVWNYYDNLEDQTPQQQRWDFMSFVSMWISGAFLLTIVTAAM